jgi:hypothetical protein
MVGVSKMMANCLNECQTAGENSSWSWDEKPLSSCNKRILQIAQKPIADAENIARKTVPKTRFLEDSSRDGKPIACAIWGCLGAIILSHTPHLGDVAEITRSRIQFPSFPLFIALSTSRARLFVHYLLHIFDYPSRTQVKAPFHLAQASFGRFRVHTRAVLQSVEYRLSHCRTVLSCVVYHVRRPRRRPRRALVTRSPLSARNGPMISELQHIADRPRTVDAEKGGM